MRKADRYGPASLDERTTRRMIASRTRSGVFPDGKNRLTDHATESGMAENWAEPKGIEHPDGVYRRSRKECGKALAEGP